MSQLGRYFRLADEAGTGVCCGEQGLLDLIKLASELQSIGLLDAAEVTKCEGREVSVKGQGKSMNL